MKKYIIAFVALCCFLNNNAQVSFTIASVSGNKNDTILVPVTTTGFTNVLATQYSFSYDSNVLAIVDIAKTANYDVNYSTHVGSALVKNGQIGFTWDAPGGVGKNIANGSTLFTLRFKLIGKECDSSFIKLVNKPTSIEVLDGNFNNLTLSANDAKEKINGTGCKGGPPPPDTAGLQIIASSESTPQGVVTCLKVTAKNFKNIQTFQFSMHWDKSVAVFDTIKSLSSTPAVGSIALSWGQNYAALPDRSGVGINWDAGANPVTVADGVTLFEVCLKPVGAAGAMTNITFDGIPVIIEVTDGNGNQITPKFTPGKLTITSSPAANLKLYYRDTMFEACGEFCLPIRVDNFKCVQNFQFSTIFDTTKLKITKINGITLPGLGPNNFNIVKDSVRVTWDGPTGAEDLPNGGVLFNICFESKLVAPNCPFDFKLRFADVGTGSPLEFSDCNSNNFNVTKGEPDITVICCTPKPDVVITLGDSVAVKCLGDCNGSVKGTIFTGGIGPFDLAWKLIPSNVVVSTILEPKDLCTGKYKFCVTDKGNGNKVYTSREINVLSPTELKCSATVTHVSATGNGAIDLTPMGGTPPYTYKWTRLFTIRTVVGSTQDITNLVANSYEIMLTDANSCMKIDTFVVNPRAVKIDTIVITAANKCYGDCIAKASALIAFGKSPYRYKWSNGDTINPAINLCKGSYTVTVTDALGNSDTRVITITEPDEIVITLDSTRKSSGTDGAAFVTVKGGTIPYRYQWKNSAGGVVSTEEDLKNAAPDSYTFCVTDKNDCVKCDTIIIAPVASKPDTITASLKIDPYPSGSAVSCSGKCDGKIIVTVTHNKPGPHTYKYKWSHSSTVTTNIATDLCPGISYTVTVTDESNNSAVSSLLVPDVARIVLETKRLACATNNTTDNGKYEAIVTGGVAPFSYNWCNGNNAKIADNLASGSCTVTVTDKNGCTSTESFTVCVVGSAVSCYKGRLAISPNGDSYNDFFVIDCVEQNDNLLIVYDRWGNQVYTAINYLNTWDGTDKDGNALTEGTYMWVLKVTESGKNDAYYKGTVTIVR